MITMPRIYTNHQNNDPSVLNLKKCYRNGLILHLVDAIGSVNGVSVTARELAANWPDGDGIPYLYTLGTSSNTEMCEYSNSLLEAVGTRLHLPNSIYPDIYLGMPHIKMRCLLTRPDLYSLIIANPGPMGIGAINSCSKVKRIFAAYHTRWDKLIPQYIPYILRPIFRFISKKMQHYIFNRADLVYAHSPCATEEAAKLGSRNTRYIKMGVTVAEECGVPLYSSRQYERANLVKIYKLNRDIPILGYAGRLAPDKSIQEMVEACDHLRLQLLIAGDGPARRKLERYKSVHLLGSLDRNRLRLFYRGIDLLLNFSRSDTLGRVLLEALGQGTPVAASDEGYHTSVLGPAPPAINFIGINKGAINLSFMLKELGNMIFNRID